MASGVTMLDPKWSSDGHFISFIHEGDIYLVDPTSGTQSKTASLIEMYRERERQSSAPTIPATAPLQIQKPSRLPVRSSSLPQEEATSKPAPASSPSAKPSVTPARTVSPDHVDDDDDEDDEIAGIEPAQPYVLGELGRSSPMRYVHGAPLHNVLEEEEEEAA